MMHYVRSIGLSAFLSTLSLTVCAENVVLDVGGRVSVELVFSESGLSNTLAVLPPAATFVDRRAPGCAVQSGLVVEDLPANALIGSEDIAQVGCRVTLDADPSRFGIQNFAPGDEIEFKMCAQTDPDLACEHVWSSDPASNTDLRDHVRITDLHPVDFRGRVIELRWEDLPGTPGGGVGDGDFNDLVAIVRVGGDLDEDGLWDDWEELGIDSDADGAIDFVLSDHVTVNRDCNGVPLSLDPPRPASQGRKDIFLEIDYMDCSVPDSDCAPGDTHTHAPKREALQAIVQAFADAPVVNPDGSEGISLHIDCSNAFKHTSSLNFAGLRSIADFDEVKSDPANFGVNTSLRFVTHYALFVHRLTFPPPATSSSGQAEIRGNDFIVSLGGWNAQMGDLDGDGVDDHDVGTAQQQAGTLMHELGHNLGLNHAGGNGVPRCNPNYLSVMNYSFQMTGIGPSAPIGTPPRLDFSGKRLPQLNERILNELTALDAGSGDETRYYCPDGSPRLASVGGPIDWNCDAPAAPGTAVNANIDNGPKCGGSAIRQLNGYNDWANLRLPFQDTRDFQDGVHETVVDGEELDYETFTEMNPGDIDGDGDVDRRDLGFVLSSRNTPADAAVDPRDLDGDGRITGLDARKLILLCTRTRCAVN